MTYMTYIHPHTHTQTQQKLQVTRCVAGERCGWAEINLANQRIWYSKFKKYLKNQLTCCSMLQVGSAAGRPSTRPPRCAVPGSSTCGPVLVRPAAVPLPTTHSTATAVTDTSAPSRGPAAAAAPARTTCARRPARTDTSGPGADPEVSVACATTGGSAAARTEAAGADMGCWRGCWC